MAVAEAARNLACVGAQPIGVSDCLNFGSPENPEIMWQFKRAVEGIADACRYFHVPVVSGNVSFYNETNGRAILPTPTIAMVGLIPDISKTMTHFFKESGHLVVLIGGDSSHYATSGYVPGMTILDLALEQRVHQAVLELIANDVIQSAHDCSEGGLAMTLLESSFENEIGVMSSRDPEPLVAEGRGIDDLLFGEMPSRVVVSLEKERLNALEDICKKYDVPFLKIGETIKERFVFNPYFDLEIKPLKTLWENAFEKIVSH